MATKETESKQQVVAEKSPMACLKALNLLSLLEHSGPLELLHIVPKLRKTVSYSNPDHSKSVQFKEAEGRFEAVAAIFPNVQPAD